MAAPSPKKQTATCCRTGSDRESAADDTVGADDALREIRDVHRAAHSLADPVRMAVNLRQHLARIAALGEIVAVTPVRAGNVVGIVQVLADTDGDGFLADI